MLLAVKTEQMQLTLASALESLNLELKSDFGNEIAACQNLLGELGENNTEVQTDQCLGYKPT